MKRLRPRSPAATFYLARACRRAQLLIQHSASRFRRGNHAARGRAFFHAAHFRFSAWKRFELKYRHVSAQSGAKTMSPENRWRPAVIIGTLVAAVSLPLVYLSFRPGKSAGKASEPVKAEEPEYSSSDPGK